MPTFAVARWLFVRSLGLVYCVAFLSLALQVRGLVGESGLVPAAEYLDRAREALGTGAWARMPTLFWLTGAGDLMLGAVCWAGVALGLLVTFGLAPRLLLFLLWASYLSMYHAGADFLGFQWDALLLETGLLAVLVAPGRRLSRLREDGLPSWIAMGLLWWLLFRLVFASGFVKLGGPQWEANEALRYHFFTQPLPTAPAWFAHQLPDAVLRFLTRVTIWLELSLPFAIGAVIIERFVPSRPLRAFRYIAFIGVTGMMLAIALTGNYGFFNVLTVVLCLLLLDDALFVRLLPRRGRAAVAAIVAAGEERDQKPRRAGTVVLTVLAVPLALLATVVFVRQVRPTTEQPSWIESVRRVTRPFASTNAYGLFARMTTERVEIVIEGSDDGEHWQPYRFRFKPEIDDRGLAWVAPHMPRLDWQMWFAALEHSRAPSRRSSAVWFQNLLLRLFQNEPSVLALLADNPFPEQPPRFLRATATPLTFANPAARAASGSCWVATGDPAEYFPVVENPWR